MKYSQMFKKAALLIVAAVTVISCSKEQALINKIEGSYKIEKAVYLVISGDSVITYPNSTMFFDNCKLKDQTAQQCKGYYEIEGQNRLMFDYLPDKDGSKEKMQINIGDFSLKPYFGGSYIIENRTEKSLVLIR